MTRFAPVLGVALVLGLSGCSGGADEAAPVSGGTTTGRPSLEVPVVERPLEVGAFADDPCGLLDEGQRRELGLPAAVRGDGAGTCDLHGDPERLDSSNYLRIVVFADGGLADQYAQCSTLDCSQWATTSVDGYPVIRATDELTSKYGGCKIFLGVADDAVVTFIDVAIDPGAGGDECGRAERAAGLVLATLR